MKSTKTHAVVLVTAPNLRVARALARAVLENRVAACVNLVPRLESHYWWKGKIERGSEVLLVMKTTQAKLPALERTVVEHHPYETPEFVVLPPRAGLERYLDWIDASVATAEG